MARVYLIHGRRDRELADQVAHFLELNGNTVITRDRLPPGREFRDSVETELRNAGVYLALITNTFGTEEEVQQAFYYSRDDGSKLFIPVVLDQNFVPPFLHGIKYIEAEPNDLDRILSEVSFLIQSHEQFLLREMEQEKLARQEHEERQQKQIEREKETEKRIEKSAAEYIQETITELKTREIDLLNASRRWYRTGYASLILGLAPAIASAVVTYTNIDSPSASWIAIGAISFKGFIIIALLVASSKYSFTLGKSFMTESLKNADRVHAISFGKFFLQVYGQKVQPQEIKEVFQHWNIAASSTFVGLDPGSYDPKLIESFASLVKTITDAKSKDR